MLAHHNANSGTMSSSLQADSNTEVPDMHVKLIRQHHSGCITQSARLSPVALNAWGTAVT